jgi:serine O-acetyltransferase
MPPLRRLLVLLAPLLAPGWLQAHVPAPSIVRGSSSRAPPPECNEGRNEGGRTFDVLPDFDQVAEYFPNDARTFAGARLTPPPASLSPGDDVSTPGGGARAKLDAMLPTFDFDTSSDAEVEAIEAVVFECLRHEAGMLSSSWLTSGLVQTCILQHRALADALAALLSGKVQSQLPGSLAYTKQGGSRVEVAKAEAAMCETMARAFRSADVRRAVVSDLLKVLVVDPAADRLLQPLLFFKGFHGLATHRVAHELWTSGSVASRGAALLLQSRAAELFSIDIHPAATIGNGVMLDHASGVVIGSTAIIGSDVYMLHAVTLGATGKPTGGAKRHPTIGSRVVLGAGCTVLGDIRVGDDCLVGASAIVTKEVPAGSTVVGTNKIITREEAPKEKAEEADGAKSADYTWYYEL